MSQASKSTAQSYIDDVDKFVNGAENPALLSYMSQLMMFSPVTRAELDAGTGSTDTVYERVQSAFPQEPTLARVEKMDSSSVYEMARSFESTYENDSDGKIIRRGSGNTQIIVDAVQNMCTEVFGKQLDELFDSAAGKSLQPKSDEWNEWGGELKGDDLLRRFWDDHWEQIIKDLKNSIPTPAVGFKNEPPRLDRFMKDCDAIVMAHAFGTDVLSRNIGGKEDIKRVISHLLKPWLVLKYLKSFEPVRGASSSSGVVWNSGLTTQRNAILGIHRIMQETLGLLRKFILEDEGLEGRVDQEGSSSPAVMEPQSSSSSNVITRALNGVRVHIVKAKATFDVKKGGDVELLLVGGGGSGGAGSSKVGGGGGGGGEVVMKPKQTLTAGDTFSVEVGEGGSGSGSDGSQTKVEHGSDTVTAAGGTGGASDGSGGDSGGSSGNAGGSGDADAYGGGGGGVISAGGGGDPSGSGGGSRRSVISGKDASYGGGGGGGQSPSSSDDGGGAGGTRSGGRGGLIGEDGMSGGKFTGGGGGGGGSESSDGSTSSGNGGDGGKGVVIIRYPFSEADIKLLSVLERISFSLSDALDTRYVSPVMDNKDAMHENVNSLSKKTKATSETLRHLDDQLQQHKSKLVVVYHNLETKRLRVRTAKAVFWTLLALAVLNALLLMIPNVPDLLHVFISLGVLLFVFVKGLRQTLDDGV